LNVFSGGTVFFIGVFLYYTIERIIGNRIDLCAQKMLKQRFINAGMKPKDAHNQAAIVAINTLKKKQLQQLEMRDQGPIYRFFITANGDEIKAAFAKLKAGSSQHHLDDAAMEGVRLLKNRGKDHRRILVLISETRDKGSAVNPRDVLTEVEFANVQVYPVEMNHFINQLTTQAEPNRPKATPPEGRNALPMGILQTGTTDAQTNMGNWAPVFPEIFALVKGVFIQNSLEVYSQFSGGREQDFVGLSGLEEAVSQIGEELHSQYLLTFSPTNKKGGYHPITVNVNAAANKKFDAEKIFFISL